MLLTRYVCFSYAKRRLLHASAVAGALIGILLTFTSAGVDAQSTGREFFVSPAGQSTATGTSADPLDLATALSTASPARAGDKIWLRGGVYFGTFTSYLTGSLEAPIVVRQYPGERATINASSRTVPALTVHGADAWYWGFEVTDTNPRRTTTNYAYTPGLRATSVNVYGPRTRFINLIVHDGEQGFGFWNPAVDAEIYGSLVYNSGIESVSQGHGHSIYVQNTTGTKRILDNILFNSFSMGVHAYTVAGRIDNIHVEGNIAFNHGVLSQASGAKVNFYMGGEDDADNPVFRQNYGYFGPSFVGGRSLEVRPWCRQGTFVDNYMAGTTAAKVYCTGGIVTGNVWAGLTAFGESYPQNTTIATRPTGTQVFVRPNKYEPGRANIAIYNWELLPSLSIDLAAAGLAIGQRFEIRDAQNFFAPPVVGGTYDGARVTVPMSFLTPATPIGNVPVNPGHTGPEFGTFVVLPTSLATSPATNVPPAVTLRSPWNGASFTAPATIALVATASDSDGTIAKVEFFSGASKLGEDLESPFTWSWSQVPAGVYTLTAKAIDDDGAAMVSRSATFTVAPATTTPNVAPTVFLTSPPSGATFTAPATVALSASAADSDGTIAKVEFFQGATKIGEDALAPFAMSSYSVPGGTYMFTARAIDNAGASKVSNAATATVGVSPLPSGANVPPLVNITSPVSMSKVNSPAKVTVTASASDADGSIARVDFYQGTLLLGTSSTAPYSAVTANLTPGSYSFTARAYDNRGTITISKIVYLTVRRPPGVSLMSPRTGEVFVAPANILLAASAATYDGTIAKVEFYSGTAKIGEDTISPYAFAWTGVRAGTYTLTAKVYDSYGGTAVSAPASATVR